MCVAWNSAAHGSVEIETVMCSQCPHGTSVTLE